MAKHFLSIFSLNITWDIYSQTSPYIILLTHTHKWYKGIIILNNIIFILLRIMTYFYP